MKFKNRSAVILCGGKGTRLGVIGKKIPKTLVKIQGREILWYIVKMLKLYNFNHFVIPLGFKGNLIKKFFKKNKNFNCKIELINTGVNSGIGRRIFLAEKEIKSENFLLLNGDAIFDFNIDKIFKNHEKNNFGISFISGEITYQYGTVGTIKNKVVDFKRNLVYEAIKTRNSNTYKAFNYTGRKLALSTSNKNTRDAAHAGQKNSLEEVYLRDILNDIDGAIAGQLQSNTLLPSHPVQPGDNGARDVLHNAFVELMAYFLFQGTGRGDSTNPANSMIVWNGATQEVLFSDCRTPQQKRDYVEKNIKNFKICMQKTSVGSGQQWPEVLGYSKKEGKVVVKSGLAVRVDLGKNCAMKSRKPAKKTRGITKKTTTKQSKTKKTKN